MVDYNALLCYYTKMFNRSNDEPNYEHGVVSPEVLDIPKECRECPQIRFLQEQINQTLLEKGMIIGRSQEAMEGLPEEIHEQVKYILSTVLGMDDVSADKNMAQAHTKMLKNIGGALDELDKDITEINETFSLLTSSCDGALKMRARKGENTFLATLCTSEIIPSECLTTVSIKRTNK